MKLRNYVNRYYGKGYNCAEAILLAANDYAHLQLTKEDVFLVGGFGGGMSIQSTCGVVTGGVAAISKKMISSTAHATPGLREAVAAYLETFEKALGARDCRTLKVNYLHETKGCLETVLLGADVLEEVLNQLPQG